jgi:hypothetical protein
MGKDVNYSFIGFSSVDEVPIIGAKIAGVAHLKTTLTGKNGSLEANVPFARIINEGQSNSSNGISLTSRRYY